MLVNCAADPSLVDEFGPRSERQRDVRVSEQGLAVEVQVDDRQVVALHSVREHPVGGVSPCRLAALALEVEALLGDRLRMVSHTMQEDVFIRSMAVRDQQGGIARGTAQAMRILDALGCDRLIVETVGVGQSEIAVAGPVDCTVLVSHPGAGDEIQAMKSGITEIGDLYVINKADQPGAEHLRRQLMSAVRLLASKDPPRQVFMVSARTGDGMTELVEAVETRLEHLDTSGKLGRQRLLNLQQEVLQLIVSRSVANVLAGLGPDPVSTYLSELEQRRMDPSTVASPVLAQQHRDRSLAQPGVAARGTLGAA